MIINCPKCKTELDLPDEAAGYRVECDCCGQKFEARDAVFNKGMEISAEAEKAQSEGQSGNATANWAAAHSYFKAAAEAGHSDSVFMSGVSEIAASQKFQDEMSDAPQSAKSAVALLFWYWKNGKQLDADTKQRYAAFRSAREEQLDDASLNFLVTEYESMNSAADVERLKAILENRRAAAAAAAAKKASVLSQYVVPDGAQSDRPECESEVMEDNPFVATDGFVSTKLTCGKCGKSFMIAHRKSVNLTDNFTIKCAIKDATYFRFTCPHCKNSATFGFRMMVYDVMKRYFIRSFDNLESMLSVHKNRSTLQGSQWGFPDEFLPFVRHRLVLGHWGLIEKVSIFEAGLDDYAIEMLKQVLEKNQQGLTAKFIYFDHLDEEKLYFNVALQDGRGAIAHVSKDMYEAIHKLVFGIS